MDNEIIEVFVSALESSFTRFFDVSFKLSFNSFMFYKYLRNTVPLDIQDLWKYTSISDILNLKKCDTILWQCVKKFRRIELILR